MKKKHFGLMGQAAVIVAVILVCFIPVFADDEPGYVRTVFNKTNGLPTDEANAVIQTDDGYLWIGSYGGLLRYDGTNFRNFSAEGAVSSQSIRTLYQDSSGKLWIGSSDSGVFVYENGSFITVPCTDEYGYLSIRDFVEDNNGKIYVASTSGVCEIRDGMMVPLDDPYVIGETIYSLGVDPYNRLWCAMNAEKCVVLQDGHCVAVLEASAFLDGDYRITCLTSDSSNNIYLGTNGTAIVKVAFTGTELDGSDFLISDFDASDTALPNRIGIADDGSILVSGEQGFALMTSDGELVDPHNASRTYAANSAIIDYEGNVWIASSDEGLVRYVPGYFATPNNEAGLDGKTVNALTELNGFFYVATDDGLFAFDGDWQPIHNDITDKLEGVQVKHLIADSRGRLWCGTYSDLGVVRYDPENGEIFCFDSSNGFKSSRVRVLLELSDGTVAVGTQDGLIFIRDNDVTNHYDKNSGMDTQSILCLAQAPDGTLFAGSAGSGIYAVSEDGKISKFSYENGLGDGVILRIVPEEDGNGYFVSAGSNLYYWSDDTFRRFDNLDIGVGSIFDIYERDGNLWLMQDSGIYSINKESLLAGGQIHAIGYGVADGLTGSLSVNTWNYIAADGRLYLATRNGISVFDFRSMSHYVPRIVIDSVRVDSVVYEHPQLVKLDRNNKRMTIDFTALTFSGTSDLCIAYRLEGFAKNETVLYGSSGSISYTNLAGGTYTFYLRVFDPDNPEVQESLQLTVIKEKRIIEQPIVWIVGVTAVVLIIIGIAHLITHSRIKRLNRQRSMYKNIVGQSLRKFANAIDAKDSYTNGHSERVAIYSREITKRLGYSENDQESVYYIALLHDIGKIGIPESILNKKGKLTPEEMAIIRTHPQKGVAILRDFTALKGLSDGALYHHEHYDGTGYCAGLAGEDIPLIGRIVCVADCYDAMSSDRCYRKALPPEKIIEELRRCSGTQFDPRIAAVMIDMIRDGVVPVFETSEIKDLSDYMFSSDHGKA